jgi:hypothetical protein
MYADDVARFGNLPGATGYNLPGMAPAQVTDPLNGPGTTIGGFCGSPVRVSGGSDEVVKKKEALNEGLQGDDLAR